MADARANDIHANDIAGNPRAVEIVDLGRLGYRDAYERQAAHHAEVLGARAERGAPAARVLVVEHDPVITVTRKAIAGGHVLGDVATLARLGVTLEETDRGGDVTYHGPGQAVVYPIVDLNRFGLRLHAYLRLLEQAIIDTIAEVGLAGQRDPDATGVWVPTAGADRAGELAKIAAIGVRVRKWVTLHGLALNVAPDMSHFGLIVPCGLHGRPVTSIEAETGSPPPATAAMGRRVAEHVVRLLGEPGQRGDVAETAR